MQPSVIRRADNTDRAYVSAFFSDSSARMIWVTILKNIRSSHRMVDDYNVERYHFTRLITMIVMSSDWGWAPA